MRKFNNVKNSLQQAVEREALGMVVFRNDMNIYGMTESRTLVGVCMTAPAAYALPNVHPD